METTVVEVDGHKIGIQVENGAIRVFSIPCHTISEIKQTALNCVLIKFN